MVVFTMVTALFGIFGNSVSSYILTRRMTFTTFNKLLAFLAWTDCTFLVTQVLDAARKELNLGIVKDVLVILFPQVIYPLRAICLTCSTLLVVSVSVERAIASGSEARRVGTASWGRG